MKRIVSGALVSALLLGASVANADDEPPAPPAPDVQSIQAPGSERACTGFEAPHADPAPVSKPAFGAAGSVVLADLLGFAAFTGSGALGGGTGFRQTGWLRFTEGTSEQVGGSTGHTTSVAFAPSVDVFVAEGLSLGGQLTVTSDHVRYDNEVSLVSAGLAPRIGMVFPLTEGLAFWPRASGNISVGHAVSAGQDLGGGGIAPADRSTVLTWGVGADALFVARIGRAVALTFGPTLSYGKTDLVEGTQSPFTFGASRSVSLAASGGIAIVL